MTEIVLREQELTLHNQAPLPESDLINFFHEYVDVASEAGRQALAAHLDSIVYPGRYGIPAPDHHRTPLSFAEIAAVLDGTTEGVLGWLVTQLERPLPNLVAIGATNASYVLTFLLQDQIKAGIARLLEEAPLQYRRREACGLPLAARRERISLLNDELLTLRAEKAEIESRIAKLKGGVA